MPSRPRSAGTQGSIHPSPAGERGGRPTSGHTQAGWDQRSLSFPMGRAGIWGGGGNCGSWKGRSEGLGAKWEAVSRDGGGEWERGGGGGVRGRGWGQVSGLKR